MHLKDETDKALAAYLKLQEQNSADNLASFFACSIKAGNGDVAAAAEGVRALSSRLAADGESISRAVATDLTALLAGQPQRKLAAVARIIVSFGDALKKEGLLREGAVCFEIASGLVPDNAHTLQKFGDTLHDLGMYEYAESVLSEALKLAPNHWDAIYTYAVLLQDLGRLDEAIEHYEKAVRLVPSHANCQNNFGAALMRVGRFDEALEHCKRAAELEPEGALARLNLGNIHLMKQEWDTARAFFEEAIKLNGELAQAYFGLGSVEQLSGGDIERSREFYRKAVELNPSIPLFREALENLSGEAQGA